VQAGVCSVESAAGEETLDLKDPFAAIEAFRARFRAPEMPGLPRFSGGLVGYFSHDTVGYIEPTLGVDGAPDELGCPDVCLLLAEELVIFDNLRGTVQLLVHAHAEEADGLARAERRLTELSAQLRAPLR